MIDIKPDDMELYKSWTDFEDIMESNFWTYGPDIKLFEEADFTIWDYNDFEHTMTFIFDDNYLFNSFLDQMSESHKRGESWEIKDTDDINNILMIEALNFGI